MPRFPTSPRRRTVLVGGTLVLVAALVTLAIGLSVVGGQPDGPAPGSGASVAGLLKDLPEQGGVIGRADAPVIVTEYADLRCPICAVWSARELPAILAAQVHPGRVRLERRIWPILGPDSDRAALGAAAAADQDKLWAFSETWYANQRPETSDYATDEFMTGIAREAGLDVDRFAADLDRHRKSAADPASPVAATKAAARTLKLTGTPAFVIADRQGRIQVIPQYASADELGTAISQALAR